MNILLAIHSPIVIETPDYLAEIIRSNGIPPSKIAQLSANLLLHSLERDSQVLLQASEAWRDAGVLVYGEHLMVSQ